MLPKIFTFSARIEIQTLTLSYISYGGTDCLNILLIVNLQIDRVGIMCVDIEDLSSNIIN